jgi:hypothetical protein
MVALLFLFLNLPVSLLKPSGRLEAENTALRRQVAVLQRKLRGRIEFGNGDRLFLVRHRDATIQSRIRKDVD